MLALTAFHRTPVLIVLQLHTSLGDLKISVFCEAVPKTAEVLIMQVESPRLRSLSSVSHLLSPSHCVPCLIRITQNFLALCASHAYDDSPIQRLIPSFMFQAGSPSPTLNPSNSTKTSTSIWNEPFEDEIATGLRHNARGIVSMANKGPRTNGSQFFVCFAAAPHLDGKNTVFGRILGGEDVLAGIEALEIDGKNRPKEKITIKGVTVHANPLAG